MSKPCVQSSGPLQSPKCRISSFRRNGLGKSLCLMVNLTSYISPSNLFLFGLSLSILSPLLYIIVSWERTKPNSLTVAFCFRHSPRCGGNEWKRTPTVSQRAVSSAWWAEAAFGKPEWFLSGHRASVARKGILFPYSNPAVVPMAIGCMAVGSGLWLYWPRDHSHGNGQDFACCGVTNTCWKVWNSDFCSALTR